MKTLSGTTCTKANIFILHPTHRKDSQNEFSGKAYCPLLWSPSFRSHPPETHDHRRSLSNSERTLWRLQLKLCSPLEDLLVMIKATRTPPAADPCRGLGVGSGGSLSYPGSGWNFSINFFPNHTKAPRGMPGWPHQPALGVMVPTALTFWECPPNTSLLPQKHRKQDHADLHLSLLQKEEQKQQEPENVYTCWKTSNVPIQVLEILEL